MEYAAPTEGAVLVVAAAVAGVGRGQTEYLRLVFVSRRLPAPFSMLLRTLDDVAFSLLFPSGDSHEDLSMIVQNTIQKPKSKINTLLDTNFSNLGSRHTTTSIQR